LIPRKMERRPASLGTFGNLSVPGTRAGAILCVGLVALAWSAIPIARPFILGTGGLGSAVGLILWWKHSR
jgi:predicted membrane protein